MSEKASKAFSAMYGEIKTRAQKLYNKNKSIFSTTSNVFLDIPDAHSVSVVTSRLGLPLHKIKLGKYTIHDKDTQVPKELPDKVQGSLLSPGSTSIGMALKGLDGGSG